ncbi:MAG: acyl carrier protein [Chitinispirillaceae bacterium]|nr:acyl carrier protein [Chitinispirillaceae bacterium]
MQLLDKLDYFEMKRGDRFFMDEKLKERIDGIILSDIGIDPATIDADKPIRDQISLDSMQFVSLIAKLEIELDVELPIAIMQVNTLREFYGAIQQALRERN